MKTYPYIAINNHDIEFLVFSEKRAIVLNGVNKGDEHNPSYFIRRYKNITHEYLQNTYGEVESPEHAEFIIELAKNEGLWVYVDSPKINRAFFTFNESSGLFFYDSEEDINKGRCKKITIPLPPKADRKESSEWPQVGDEVCWSNGKRKGELKSICDGWAWIKDDGGEFVSLMAKFIKKPKTPEEKLRDDILDCDNFAITESKATQLANWLTNKGYEIKKKPQ